MIIVYACISIVHLYVRKKRTGQRCKCADMTLECEWELSCTRMLKSLVVRHRASFAALTAFSSSII